MKTFFECIAAARAASLAALLLASLAGCAAPPWGSQAATQSPPGTMEQQLSLARLSERHGKLDAAEKIYQGIVAKDPKDQNVQHRLGAVLARQGRLADAAPHFQAALSAGPPSAELLADAGYFCYLQDHLDEAERNLRAALEKDPSNQRARNNLALVLGNQGHVEESLAEFRQVVGEDEAYANLGYVLAQRGQLTSAKQCYGQALTLNNSLRPAAEALVQLERRKSGPGPTQAADAVASATIVQPADGNRDAELLVVSNADASLALKSGTPVTSLAESGGAADSDANLAEAGGAETPEREVHADFVATQRSVVSPPQRPRQGSSLSFRP